jgi:hypothetical protein
MVRNLWDSISNIYLEPTPPYWRSWYTYRDFSSVRMPTEGIMYPHKSFKWITEKVNSLHWKSPTKCNSTVRHEAPWMMIHCHQTPEHWEQITSSSAVLYSGTLLPWNQVSLPDNLNKWNMFLIVVYLFSELHRANDRMIYELQRIKKEVDVA